MRHMMLLQDGPINTLALNKDCNKVVVAGRNIFRVCEIKEDGFVERDNIRTGKNSNLNFSCNDASWNPVDEQWLATAATNGAVVLWNIHRSIKLKQETVYYDHKRTVNKVTFHGTEQNMLLSGSQDGTMKYFDIRMKSAAVTFVSNAESVRDVQFNPHQNTSFAAVSENGTVQLWDLRRQDRCEKQFTAHSGPVFACDWHPEVRTWLATAGRDRAVKVWDLGFRPVLEFTVTTMASVGRIKWRPQKTHHIASCALVIDSSIHVWDIRRPYIPYASFNDHKDITTSIAWRGSADVLLSTSKDSYLIQHVFSDAERPTEKANPVCVSYNSQGCLTLATALHNDRNAKSKTSVNAQKKYKESDDSPAIRCSIYVFENHAPSPAEVLEHCARKYLLSGRSMSELCDHNANVSWSVGRCQVATIWRMAKLLLSCGAEVSWMAATAAAAVAAVESGNRIGIDSSDPASLVVEFGGSKESRPGTRHQSGNAGADNVSMAGGINGQASAERGDTSGGVSEEAESEVEDLDSHGRTLSHIASGFHFNSSDFLFGDTDADVINDFDMVGSTIYSMAENDLEGVQLNWNLPSEAFQPRHPIKDRSPPPEHYASRCFAENKIETQTVQIEDQTSALLCLPGIQGASCWNGTANVVEMLYYLAEQGDVQTVVSLVLVLGDRVKNLLSEPAVEHWFYSYIDTLSRFRLWNTAALVIKMSPCTSVQRLSHRSTVYCTNCNMCRRSLQRAGWMCDACKSITNTCSLCHLVVRGLYVWCRGCCHGGHLLHIKEWFETNDTCPTGCGHHCEFEC